MGCLHEAWPWSQMRLSRSEADSRLQLASAQRTTEKDDDRGHILCPKKQRVAGALTLDLQGFRHTTWHRADPTSHGRGARSRRGCKASVASAGTQQVEKICAGWRDGARCGAEQSDGEVGRSFVAVVEHG